MKKNRGQFHGKPKDGGPGTRKQIVLHLVSTAPAPQTDTPAGGLDRIPKPLGILGFVLTRDRIPKPDKTLFWVLSRGDETDGTKPKTPRGFGFCPEWRRPQ